MMQPPRSLFPPPMVPRSMEARTKGVTMALLVCGLLAVPGGCSRGSGRSGADGAADGGPVPDSAESSRDASVDAEIAEGSRPFSANVGPDPLRIPDGAEPFVWRDDQTGGLHIWHMQYASSGPGTIVGSLIAPDLRCADTQRLAGYGDYDGDGRLDFLVQNLEPAHGTRANLYLVRSTDDAYEVSALDLVDTRDHLVAVARLFPDQVRYAIFRSHRADAAGELYARVFSGTSLEAPVRLTAQHLGWRVAGSVRFPGDDRDVLIVHNRRTGRLVSWSFNTPNAVPIETELSSSLNPAEFDALGGARASDGRALLLFRSLWNGGLLAWSYASHPGQALAAFAVSGPLSFRYLAEPGEPDYKHLRRQYPTANVFVPGDRYLDNVPDTLDLAERAELALEAMHNLLDTQDADNMFWISFLGVANPLTLAGNYPQMNAKFLEAMPLLRRMTGNAANLAVDNRMLAALSKDINRQGIYLMPLRDLAPGNYIVSYRDGHYAHLFNTLPQARYLSALSNYFRLMGRHVLDPEVVGERLVNGIREIARPGNGYLEFFYDGSDQRRDSSRYGAVSGRAIPWSQVKETTADLDDPAKPYSIFQVSDHTPRLIYGPADYYRLFGLPAAKEVALGFSRWVSTFRSRMFDAEHNMHPMGPSEQVCVAPGHDEVRGCPASSLRGAPHVAVRTKTLSAMLNTAIAANDDDLLRFVEHAYHKIRAHPSSRWRIGYFPEYASADRNVHQHVETDEVADMIELATRLSRFAGRDLWDDVDHYVRNHFAEMQLTDEKVASLEGVHKGLVAESVDVGLRSEAGDLCRVRSFDAHGNESSSARCKSGPGLIAAHRGAWGSYSTPNAWGYLVKDARGAVVQSKFGVMNCCLASAARVLHVVWDSMLERTGPGAARIHLLLNRASKEFDVYSWLPHHGRVDIRHHVGQPPQTIDVRMPEWIPPREAQVAVTSAADGQPVPFTWVGDSKYIRLTLRDGAQLTISFPVRDVIESIVVSTPTAPQKSFSFRFRGTQVVGVSPPGLQAVGGRTLGVPLYASFSSSLAGDIKSRWVPPAPGEMLHQVERFVPAF